MTMTPDLLSLALLFSLSVSLAVGRAVSADMEKVEALSGWNCTLKCSATYKPGVHYSAISWYKLRENSGRPRSGLLRSDLNGTTLRYSGVDREMELLEDSHDIFLPNVTCKDSGVYLCHLAAPVGEQNQEGRVLLTLTDCPAHPTDLPIEAKDNLIDLHDFPVDSTKDQSRDIELVVTAAAILMVALIIGIISYTCTKNTFKESKQQQHTTKKEILLDAPLKPLEKKDLKLIYTLGPKTNTVKQVIV
ncbi:CD83 antigen [Melanotaenia boesemani]|uniref:CD83 antigen n=1 Tax=Melanotaenia boesemani TaxID=1250792 RepID=UPI001C046916|nr:CD83 antigen [Melanotaenia boesemani]